MSRRNSIIIIIVLVVTIVSLGVAFAAFSTTLNINGSATVESSSWNIVFEGITNDDTLDAPTLTGRAAVTTAPTIKNNATEISSYAVTLQAPGDSVTYNFKIHNKGSFAASVSSIVMNSGVNLTTNTSKRTSEANTLNAMEYKLYYTDNNQLVGQSPKDCLEPGEYENVSLKIIFSKTTETNTNVLPSEDLLLDNLGIAVNYQQASNNSCALEAAGEVASNSSFANFDGAYYTYEGKSFIGTGVNNVIISETITSLAKYATANGTDNGDGTYTFADSPAADAAALYCTGCRLMTKDEALSWDSTSGLSTKRIGKYNGSNYYWWLADARDTNYAWHLHTVGNLYSYFVTSSFGVRPAVSISNTATMSGSGTSSSPYVITVSQ